MKKNAIILDIDGTIAEKHPDRGIYEFDKVWMDKPITTIIDLSNGMFEKGYSVVIITGRDVKCEKETLSWIKDNSVLFDELHMRPTGNYHPDTIIKEGIVKQLENKYNFVAAIEDRPSVARMYRKIGIPTIQVGNPDKEF